MGINDPDIFSVAPIRCYKNGTKIGDATGFFFYFNDLYFITNRHAIVEEIEGYYPDEIRLLLHKKDNITENRMFPISLYEDGKELWLEHPQLGKDVDVVAFAVDGEKICSQFFVRGFSIEEIMPPYIDLSIGEDVRVIGYPLGFRDTINNFPIARNASVASVYPIPFENKPGFLIDSRLHRGTSGSPVLTKSMDRIRTIKGDIIEKYPPPRFLLGIHSETLDVLDRDPEMDEPLGLNFVWFADLIPEIILAGNTNESYKAKRMLKKCTAIIERDPSDLTAWGEIGNAHTVLGNYTNALQAYDKVLELNPSDAKAWNNKGLILVELGDDKEAIYAYDKAIELDQNLEPAWSNKGNVLSGQGDHQKAFLSFSKAAELNPSDKTNWNNKGGALSSQGKHDEAIQAYDKAIELDPKYAKAWHNKGNALSMLGRTSEANAAFAKAKELGYMS